MQDSSVQALVTASKPVRYAAAAALSVLALFLLVLTINALGNLGRSENPYMNTITVEGKGTGTAIPDIATVSFSVTERGATVAEAQDKATTKTDAALAAVSGLAIEEEDVKTLSYNVYPQYEQQVCYTGICTTGAPRIVGYEVSQTVEVKIRETGKAGDVLQALGSLNVQNINGPNFTVDQEDGLKGVAREAAIENAKAKAEALADQLGVRLGKVVSFYENTAPYPYYGYDGAKGGMMMEAAQMAPSLPTGEQETEVSVSITYEIR